MNKFERSVTFFTLSFLVSVTPALPILTSVMAITLIGYGIVTIFRS